MPSETLKSLNDTNIEVLFRFLNYMANDEADDIPEWFKPYSDEFKRKEEIKRNGK